jgi:hypothetical protein
VDISLTANPEVWEALKREFFETYNELYMKETITRCKQYNLHIEDNMVVVPTPFSTEGAQMLQHTKWLLEETDEDGNSLIAIHKERFHKLVTALRTAVANEYKLIKYEPPTTIYWTHSGYRCSSTRGANND